MKGNGSCEDPGYRDSDDDPLNKQEHVSGGQV
jgi:hypothetical protein